MTQQNPAVSGNAEFSNEFLKETEGANEARQEVQHPLGNQTRVEWALKQNEPGMDLQKIQPAVELQA